MPNKEYDLLVFIGRFQPYHDGHKTVVEEALQKANKLLIIIGSHDEPRSIRNPFTSEERKTMIEMCHPGANIVFAYQEDHKYNLDKWISSVQEKVKHAVDRLGWFDMGAKVGLIGHSKDNSSFYLNCFPKWDSVKVDDYLGVNATDIRTSIFKNCALTKSVPKEISELLYDLMETRDFIALEKEYEFVQKYKNDWKDTPYPVCFQAVDAVVVQAGHVLLIRRRAEPGKGLWALPGGFLDVSRNETLKEAVLRELREETKIDVPVNVLERMIIKSKTYDDPFRSERGRMITNAFLFRLRDDKKLPKIKGSDDADKAKWVPISELKRNKLFNDHYSILEDMIGI